MVYQLTDQYQYRDLDSGEVLRALRSTTHRGLDKAELAGRLGEYGPTEI